MRRFGGDCLLQHGQMVMDLEVACNMDEGRLRKCLTSTSTEWELFVRLHMVQVPVADPV